MYIKQGGGKIKRKFILSVLFICGFALVLNMNFSSAATVNQTNSTVNSVSTPNTGNLTVASAINTTATIKTTATPTTVKAATTTVPKVGPKVTSTNPAGNSIVSKSQNIKIIYNETIKAGTMWIVLTNSAGTVINTENSISGNTLTVAPTNALASGIKYILAVHTNSIEDLSGDGTSVFSTTFGVSPTTTVAAASAAGPVVDGLTLAQVKDGLSRAQSFTLTNGRLPTYVSYGSTHIPIAQFEQILTTEGLKIVGNLNRPIYITSDNINNPTVDNARINSIIAGLKALGLKAFNMGLGPNTHDTILTSGNLPSNAVVVDIYGGADAGLIKEMGTAWYKAEKGARTVFSVYWPPSTDITGLAFLPRAHDDNYDPSSFTGLANPAEYLLENGYDYIHSGTILNIVNAIFYQ
ncbi:MAG: Ig-like domain-containing protein, partial [Methanobacterium sp.]